MLNSLSVTNKLGIIVYFLYLWVFQAYRIAKKATITPITTNKDAPTVPTVTATLSNEGFKVSKETDSNEKEK